MPLSETMLWLLRGLRSILLLWVGLLGFALLLNVTGLRDGPGASSFSEMRQELELRVSATEGAVEHVQAPRFDNFLVSVYLIPLFLFRGICRLGARRAVSPAAVLAAILAIGLISVGLGQALTGIDTRPDTVDRDTLIVISVWIFGFLVGLPILIRTAVSISAGLPLAVADWLLYGPAKLDRFLRRVFDIRVGRLAAQFGHRMSYASNALLVAGLCLPSTMALWWICDWLDGRGESGFALLARAAIIAACLGMLARDHMRLYAPARRSQPQ